METVFTRHLLDPEILAIWSERATVQAWFDTEAALAAAQAELGMIPHQAAATIAAGADAGPVDLDRMARDILFTQHPFVPALHQLEAQCGDAAGFVHWGATTQNIFDTGNALLLKRTQSLLLARLADLLHTLSELAGRTRDTPQAGRTHGQHALPITFGFKLAGWMAELRRHGERLQALEPRVLVARMGGAVAAYAAMEGKGRAVQAGVAARLHLHDGGIPARSAMDHFAEYVNALALLAATIEKIAANLIHLQRTEIAEVAEGHHHGKVGSSTMPQKRNPAALMNLVSLARQVRLRAPAAMDAMVQLDEADGAADHLSGTALREAAVLATSALTGLLRVVGNLHVDAAAMDANLARTRGLIMTEAAMMALAPLIGRNRAHELMYEVAMAAFEAGESLAEALPPPSRDRRPGRPPRSCRRTLARRLPRRGPGLRRRRASPRPKLVGSWRARSRRAAGRAGVVAPTTTPSAATPSSMLRRLRCSAPGPLAGTHLTTRFTSAPQWPWPCTPARSLSR